MKNYKTLIFVNCGYSLKCNTLQIVSNYIHYWIKTCVMQFLECILCQGTIELVVSQTKENDYSKHWILRWFKAFVTVFGVTKGNKETTWPVRFPALLLKPQPLWYEWIIIYYFFVQKKCLGYFITIRDVIIYSTYR